MLLLDYYKWQVVLKDGTVIDYNKDFKFNKDNKDFANIKTFTLLPQDKSVARISLNLPEGSRLIYFRRMIGNTGNIFPKFHINMIGWQITTDNTNLKFINYIFPDGTIESSDGDEPAYTDSFINKLPKQAISNNSDCIECIPTKIQ